MNFKQIKGFANVFIDETSGVLFSVKNGKDVPLKLTPSIRLPTVNINGNGHKVLDLILSTYDFKFSETDRISYRVNKLGFIAPSSIKIKSSGSLKDGDSGLCLKYKCNIKAASANSRFKDKISAGSILQVLKIADYKCVYCGCDINPDDWHLDHYHPKAFGGANTLENIVPACSICNKMKGALDGINFLKRCKNICINNKILSDEERNKFNNGWSESMKDRNKVVEISKQYKSLKNG